MALKKIPEVVLKFGNAADANRYHTENAREKWHEGISSTRYGEIVLRNVDIMIFEEADDK